MWLTGDRSSYFYEKLPVGALYIDASDVLLNLNFSDYIHRFQFRQIAIFHGICHFHDLLANKFE